MRFGSGSRGRSGVGLERCDYWESGLRETGGVFDAEGMEEIENEAGFLLYVELHVFLPRGMSGVFECQARKKNDDAPKRGACPQTSGQRMGHSWLQVMRGRSRLMGAR